MSKLVLVAIVGATAFVVVFIYVLCKLRAGDE